MSVLALVFSLAVLGSAAPAAGSDAPLQSSGPAFPILGFNNHNDKTDSRMSLGGWVRMDCNREHVEKHGAQWMVDQVLAMKRMGLKPIVILMQARSRSRADFADWAGNFTRPLQGMGVVWEVWNEPNIPEFWDHPNPGEYTKLFGKVRAAIPKSETLITGGLSTVGSELTPKGGLDRRFLQGMVDAGIRAHADGISIHPYQPLPANGARVADQIEEARRVTGMPIYATECGILPEEATRSGKTQGGYLIECLRAAERARAMCFIWYRWPAGAPGNPSFMNGMVSPSGAAREPLIRLQQEAARVRGG